MKKYIVEFTHIDGVVEKVELTTDNIDWSIEQWTRNRQVANYKIINEGSYNSKQMLFG